MKLLLKKMEANENRFHQNSTINNLDFTIPI